MAIIFLQKKKNQTMLIFVFVGIILLIGLIWYFGYFKKSKEVPLSNQEIPLVPEENIEIDFDVLKNPLVKELQLFSEIQPLSTSTDIGKINPFLPY